MTELNHNLRGLALGGIRRFTTLAKERGDCILLTLGEPEFDTPVPIRQACKDALDQGRTHPATKVLCRTMKTARFYLFYSRFCIK